MMHHSNPLPYVAPRSEEAALFAPESLLTGSVEVEQNAVIEDFVAIDLFELL